jgi:hypothetical protein
MANKVYEGKVDLIDLGREGTRALATAPFSPLAGLPDTAGDAFWNALRWWESGFDQDLSDFLKDTLFDRKLKKSKRRAVW